MSSLKEALENSEAVKNIRQAEEVERQAAEQARKEKVANLTPYQRWWQNFRFTATKYEIKVFIKVQANQWHEALDFIAARKLNSLTTRCKTREEAVEQLRAKILAWQAENVLVADQEPPAGALLYWRIWP